MLNKKKITEFYPKNQNLFSTTDLKYINLGKPIFCLVFNFPFFLPLIP